MLFSFLAFGLSLVGLIHAEQTGLSFSPITIGYLLLTILFGIFHLAERKQETVDDEIVSSTATTKEEPVISG